jgi:hypothetical protein
VTAIALKTDFLADKVEYRLGCSAHLFIHNGRGDFPTILNYLLGYRNRQRYKHHGLAPNGGINDPRENGSIEQDAEALRRELVEEIVGKETGRRTEAIRKLINDRVQADKLRLIHREVLEPDQEGWDATVDRFYVLSENFTKREYKKIRGFMAMRNRKGPIAGEGATGEIESFHEATAAGLFTHALERKAAGMENSFSLRTEQHAWHHLLHRYIADYFEQNYAMRAWKRGVKNVCQRLHKPSALVYKPGPALMRQDANGKMVLCRELEDNQPTFKRSVKGHSRGIRFMEIAKERTRISDGGRITEVEPKQVIAKVMRFDEQGRLYATNDVYVPKDKHGQPLTFETLEAEGYKRMDTKGKTVVDATGEAYAGSDKNGLYVRMGGDDFDCLPYAIKEPTFVNGKVIQPGGSLVRYTRKDGTVSIEGMEQDTFMETVVALPRRFAAMERTVERRHVRGRTPQASLGVPPLAAA